MLTIETTVTVDEDGTLTMRLPTGVRPGLHRVVLIVRDADRPAASPAGDAGGTEVGDVVGTPEGEAAAYEAVYSRARRG